MKSMIYCHNCASKLKEGTIVCPECGAEVTTTLKPEEVRPLVQKIHKKSNFFRGKIDNGLSFIVLGLTILIIGLLFYYLSLTEVTDATDPNLKYEVANHGAPEFWVFVVGVSVGGVLFLAGLALALSFNFLRRNALSDIESIRTSGSPVVKGAPLLVVIWARAIRKTWKELRYRLHRRYHHDQSQA
jgi:hypothetical protein